MKKTEMNAKIHGIIARDLSVHTAHVILGKILPVIDEYLETNQADMGESLLKAFAGAVKSRAAKKKEGASMPPAVAMALMAAQKWSKSQACGECVDIDPDEEFPETKPETKPLPKMEMAGMIEPKECPACGSDTPEHNGYCGLDPKNGRAIWD